MERKDNTFKGIYETPVLELLDCISEGILCNSGQGEQWVDGGLI
jgi:hypothetical protein